MFRDRASDANDLGLHGNGKSAGVGVADTPEHDAVFLDNSQAPHVVSEDEVQERRPELVAEEGDIIEGVESERDAQAEDRSPALLRGSQGNRGHCPCHCHFPEVHERRCPTCS